MRKSSGARRQALSMWRKDNLENDVGHAFWFVSSLALQTWLLLGERKLPTPGVGNEIDPVTGLVCMLQDRLISNAQDQDL